MRMSEWWRRLRQLVRINRFQSDLDEEMQLHIELRARANRSEGMSEANAARAARVRFGNVALVREDSREVWIWRTIERGLQDLRYGVRQIGRRGTSTFAVIATLALGIGANTAMFTVLNATLFAHAPVDAPDRLAWVVLEQTPSGRLSGLSTADVRALQQRGAPFEGVTAFSPVNLALGGAVPERIRGLVVSANYFDVLGVRAAIGRTFVTSEDRTPGAHPVLVLTDGLWRRRFGADPGIVNQSVVLNGAAFTVIGVAPRGFTGIELMDGDPLGAWVPMATIDRVLPGERGLTDDDGPRWLRVVARLAPGVVLTKADAALRSFDVPSRPLSPPEARVQMTAVSAEGGLDPSNRRQIAPVLGLLALVPTLVLIVACANAANLMLARGVDRRREMALRRSLGASRGRIVRQLLTESVIFASIAGFAGLLVARGLLALIGRTADIPDAMMASFAVDLRVLIATVAVAVLTGVLFGLAPALASSNPDLTGSLKDESLTVTASRRRQRLRGALVVSQVTVSLVLLITAGLFLRSFSRTLNVDPGFDARQSLALSFDLKLQGYQSAASDAFAQALLERAVVVPGVDAVALTSTRPLGGNYSATDAVADSQPGGAPRVFTFETAISSEYFRAMGMSLGQGRAFDAHDTAASAPVAIVSQTLAMRLWSDADPIGKRVDVGGGGTWCTVVGVAGDIRFRALDDRPVPVLYRPLAQRPSSPLSLIVHTTVDPQSAIGPVSAVVHGLDPNLPIFGARTLSDQMLLSLDAQRASSSLIGVFGAIALLLAVVGIYGVASHASRLRTREAGIRIALGATAPDVRRLFLWDGVRLTLIGVAAGLALSFVAAQAMASFLFGFGANDAFVFIAGAVVLGATAAAASYGPAWRASRIDPMAALRTE
jgi:predicted permease